MKIRNNLIEVCLIHELDRFAYKYVIYKDKTEPWTYEVHVYKIPFAGYTTHTGGSLKIALNRAVMCLEERYERKTKN